MTILEDRTSLDEIEDERRRFTFMMNNQTVKTAKFNYTFLHLDEFGAIIRNQNSVEISYFANEDINNIFQEFQNEIEFLNKKKQFRVIKLDSINYKDARTQRFSNKVMNHCHKHVERKKSDKYKF